MELKKLLINTALLGIEKKSITDSEVPHQLNEIALRLAESFPEKESQFLTLGAVSLNMLKAGFQPPHIKLVKNSAEEENLPYCSTDAANTLSTLLGNNYQSLIWLWVSFAANNGVIAPPQLLPTLFKWGVTHKKTSSEIFIKVIGKRGKWLSQFDNDWKSIFSSSVEDVDWETASAKERIDYLGKLRLEQPLLAIQKIKSIWKDENAASRTELLTSLNIGISIEDEEFLLTCLEDKSIKVKEKAFELLKLIDSGKVLTDYKNVVASSIVLSQSKVFGLISLKEITILLKNVDEFLFKTGIEKLSSDKKVKDEDYILYQLISEISPNFWTNHFSMTPTEVIHYFDVTTELSYFRVALCRAIYKFQEVEWALLALDKFGKDQHYLLNLLALDDLIKYAPTFLKSQLFESTIQLLIKKSELNDWPLAFSKTVVQEFARNVYWNNKATCEALSLYLPSAILPEINQIEPQEEYRKSFWKNLQSEFNTLIELKESIKKSLNI